MEQDLGALERMKLEKILANIKADREEDFKQMRDNQR